VVDVEVHGEGVCMCVYVCMRVCAERGACCCVTLVSGRSDARRALGLRGIQNLPRASGGAARRPVCVCGNEGE